MTLTFLFDERMRLIFPVCSFLLACIVSIVKRKVFFRSFAKLPETGLKQTRNKTIKTLNHRCSVTDGQS